MATASILTSSASRKHPPLPELILRTYRQEASTSGERGAENRVAPLLGISADTVRRVVARDEAARKAREETPPAHIFTPPDAAYEAERDITNRKYAAELAVCIFSDRRQSHAKSEQEGDEFAATTPHDDVTDRRADELGNTPHDEPPDPAYERPERQGVPYDGDAEMEPRPTGVPRSPSGHEQPEERLEQPGHARPDLDEPGAEQPELPPEAFPNPEPNQPPDAAPGRPELPHHDRPARPPQSPATDRQSVPDWPTEPPTDPRRQRTAARAPLVTEDQELLADVDLASRELHTTRSAFIRTAIQDALHRHRIAAMERRHAEAYAKHPVQPDELDVWFDEQSWPEG